VFTKSTYRIKVKGRTNEIEFGIFNLLKTADVGKE